MKNGEHLLEYVPDYVVLDLVATGFSIEKGEIIEIAAIKVKRGEVVDMFSSLVRPTRPLSASVAINNKIASEMLQNAPVIENVITDFLSFVGDEVLVGDNLIGFDLCFLQEIVQKCRREKLMNGYVDLQCLSRKRLPQLKHHKLSDIAKFFRIEMSEEPCALEYCAIVQKCFEELRKL